MSEEGWVRLTDDLAERVLFVQEARRRREQAADAAGGDGGGPQKAGEVANAPVARLVRVADVQSERVRWLWRGWLPAGKLVIVEGDPGEGKSTLTLDLAARLSAGSPLPDGSPGVEPADVVLLSAEDGIADTIRPRLEAAGADLARIHVLAEVQAGQRGRPPEIPGDVPLLETVVRERKAGLVVVDPLAAFLAGSIDSHRDQDVRRALHALAALADRTGCTVLVLRHLNKSGGAKAIYRGGGSIGIIGAARVGLLVAADPKDDSRRVLAVVKSNLAAKPEALAYRLVTDAERDVAKLSWEGPAGYTADELLATRSEDERSAEDEAEEFLRAELEEGPKPASEVRRAAGQAGIAERTLRRAKDRIGVVARRVGGVASGGYWTWELPKMATTKMATASEDDGHLSGNGLNKPNSAPDSPPGAPKVATVADGHLRRADGPGGPPDESKIARERAELGGASVHGRPAAGRDRCPRCGGVLGPISGACACGWSPWADDWRPVWPEPRGRPRDDEEALV
ncbi:MAG: AAA family ATPase [Rhodospirillales bacterium]|nr:AAA family ATPase [Rhodospirillales bacterium]